MKYHHHTWPCTWAPSRFSSASWSRGPHSQASQRAWWLHPSMRTPTGAPAGCTQSTAALVTASGSWHPERGKGMGAALDLFEKCFVRKVFKILKHFVFQRVEPAGVPQVAGSPEPTVCIWDRSLNSSQQCQGLCVCWVLIVCYIYCNYL